MAFAESWQRTETEEEIDRKLKEIFQRIMTNDEYNTSPSAKETSSLARRGAKKETSSLARRGASLKCHRSPSVASASSDLRINNKTESVDPLTIAAQSRDDSKKNKNSKKKMNTDNNGGYHE